MTPLECALNNLEQHQKEMLHLWETIVRYETPSGDAAAVDLLAAHLDTYCDALGMETEKSRPESAGTCLAARTPVGDCTPLLLLGHLDTVHPAGSFPGGVWTVREGAVFGPGVHDCKGGLAIALYVIRALQSANYKRRQIRLVLVSDEETAHTLSKRQSVEFLCRHAVGCGAAFTLESGLPSGDVVTERKGGGITKLTVRGIASHAGTAPEKGASAILEAARKIVAIQSLFAGTAVTCNCGTIRGGTSANVIPDCCEISVALRYRTNAQGREATEALQALCQTAETPGTSCALSPLVGFPAMEKTPKTDALFALYRKASLGLGLGAPEAVSSSGCSDSAYTTALGIPTLCALGVLGEGQHSPQEHARIDTLLTQAKRLTAAILALPDDF